jgi:hypothetical protein
MIKAGYLKILTIGKDGERNVMSFEEYNRLTGDEFLSARMQAKYHQPILPLQEVKISSKFLAKRRTPAGRDIFQFRMEGEHFFTVGATFIYPLNLSLIGK